MKAIRKVADLFAFWDYDTFPYVLGAPVLEMNANGAVRPRGYGGYWFRPIRLVSLSVGQKVWATLEKLRAERRAAEKALNEQWRRKALDALREAGIDARTLRDPS
jgi:hypothetical protein